MLPTIAAMALFWPFCEVTALNATESFQLGGLAPNVGAFVLLTTANNGLWALALLGGARAAQHDEETNAINAIVSWRRPSEAEVASVVRRFGEKSRAVKQIRDCRRNRCYVRTHHHG